MAKLVSWSLIVMIRRLKPGVLGVERKTEEKPVLTQVSLTQQKNKPNESMTNPQRPHQNQKTVNVCFLSVFKPLRPKAFYLLLSIHFHFDLYHNVYFHPPMQGLLFYCTTIQSSVRNCTAFSCLFRDK